MYTYTFQMLCTAPHVARIQTEFCGSCPHSKRDLIALTVCDWPKPHGHCVLQ